MEKLIELLNKAQNDAHLFGHYIGSFEWEYYAKNHWRLIVDNLGYTDEQYETFDYSDRDICGKDGGFIQRLVENDKINFNGLPNIFTSIDAEKRDDVYYEIKRNNYSVLIEQYGVNLTDRLLMLLSISDTPIEDLLLYLK